MDELGLSWKPLEEFRRIASQRPSADPNQNINSSRSKSYCNFAVIVPMPVMAASQKIIDMKIAATSCNVHEYVNRAHINRGNYTWIWTLPEFNECVKENPQASYCTQFISTIYVQLLS